MKPRVTDDGHDPGRGRRSRRRRCRQRFDRLRDGAKVTVFEPRGSGRPPRREHGAVSPSRILHRATRGHFAADGGDPARRASSPSRSCRFRRCREVDYPTIQVLTFYPGASPGVVATTVTAPLERQFGQLQGLEPDDVDELGRRRRSSSCSSTCRLSIDVAEEEVQSAINAAQSFLPVDPADAAHLQQDESRRCAGAHAGASRRTTMPLSAGRGPRRYAARAEDLAAQRAWGCVSISGGQKPAVRIQANPTALSSYGIDLEDLRTALTQTSVNAAKGNFDGPRQDYQIDANDQLVTSDDYRNVVVAYRNGAPVMLTDVARIVNGVENDDAGGVDERDAGGDPERPAPARRQHHQRGQEHQAPVAAARGRRCRRGCRSRRSPISPPRSRPRSRTWSSSCSSRSCWSSSSSSCSCAASRATIIPSVAVPLSLVGTFGVMYALGYSLDNLSMMALTISTGFVVDDAIVMIENISRYIEEGEPPMQAALKGAEQIGFTILSLTVSLIAVLIPLLFMGDVVGRLFREFAVTLAVTIVISAVVSLTLTPMMCARILRRHSGGRAGTLLPSLGARLRDASSPSTARTLKVVLRHQTLTLFVVAGDAGADGLPLRRHPQGALPGPGHGRHPGHLAGAADDQLHGHGREAAGAREGGPRGPGGREPVVVHRRRRHEHDAEQRAHVDQPEAAGGAQDQRVRSSIRRLHRATAARSRASSSSCSRCRTSRSTIA